MDYRFEETHPPGKEWIFVVVTFLWSVLIYSRSFSEEEKEGLLLLFCDGWFPLTYFFFGMEIEWLFYFTGLHG